MPKLVSFTANRLDLGLDLNSSRNLKPGQLSSAQSVRVQQGGGVYTGPGYLERVDLATNADTYIHEGTVFSALWAKSGAKIYYVTDPDAGTKYDTGATPTTTETGFFVEQGNGDMHYFNQTDDPLHIAVARVTVAVADTDVTITVGAEWIDKFSGTNPSTAYINGDAITYTGKNATQLTGVTGIQSGGHAVNSIIVQTSNPSTFTEEKGTFGFEFESRMIIGGVKHLENVAHASAPEDEDHPEYFYDFDGNGEVKRILSGTLTAGIKGIGRSFLFTNRSVYQLIGFDVATGAFLMGTGPINEYYGAYNPRCVVNMDGIVSFFGRKRLMPLNLQLSPDGATPSFDDTFDEPIRPWINTLDDDANQDIALLSYDSTNKVKKITARVNGAAETYVYDRQSRVFVSKESRPAVSFALLNGKSYFGGNDGKIYEDDYGRSNNGNAIFHKWSTGRIEYEEGRTEMQAREFICDGFMMQGTEFTLRIYINGATTADFEQLYDDSLITSDVGTALGTNGVGNKTIAGSNSSPLAYPFKLPLYLRGFSGEDFRFEWEVSGDGMFLQVDSFDFKAYVLSRTQRSYE